MVPALAGQWILLFTLYLGLTQKIDESKLTWIFLIILSSLINFYFMVPIVAIYSLLRIFNLKFEKEIFFKLIKDFFIIGLLLLLTLYIVGYFEVRMIDILALGFGRDKLNLLSIFDSNNSFDGLSWSWFLPDIKLTQHEEFEGFNYLGLGQIIMLIFVLILFFRKKYKKNLFIIKNSKEIKYFIFISIFMTLWALSNKISFGSYTLIEIPLNKYIYGVLSIVRPTGRLFWIVNNFILIMSIVIIFKCFNKKNSLLIITFFLIIQVVDTSAGIKQRINFFIAKNFIKKYIVDSFESDVDHFHNIYSYTSLLDKKALLNSSIPLDDIENDFLDKFIYLFNEIKNETYYNKMMYVFEKIHLVGLLHRLDVSTMAASIEARVPFVDHRLVEFAFSIPFKYKMKWCEDSSKYNSRILMSDQISEKYDPPKYLLKKAFENKLPNEILYRKKSGFPVPLHDWLGGKFRKYTKNILLSRVAKNRKIYNIDNIKKILDSDSDKLREDHRFAMKIWMLVNLELFIGEYFDE
mgnify:CR=1 FL=1